MTDDSRCCGTGTCLIDAQGRCWCGQQWDGEQMCRPTSTSESQERDPVPAPPAQGAPAADSD